ncbi:hypothetical protein B0H16DRAFT_1574624 [Mycena metata]|uniref:MYND-type domain-containing protein n=1 Tax=Mycena metata TaxID=1033252 RepID=A0AAD7I8C2_9AGAR|nr:hypothetical protein B0H16DRAFT_1574624 [Mycena metata]
MSQSAAAEFNAVAGKRFKEKDYIGAAENYERATAEAPSVATYFSNLAAAYLKLEKYQAAEQAARRALVLEPRLSKARHRRAMARKGLNCIPEALVDIVGVLTATPENLEARAAFDVLVDIQNKTGRRPLEAPQIVALDFPHAYGSSFNSPLQNRSDPHQLSLPFIFKVDVDEAPGHAALDPDLCVSACMTCKRTNGKKNLKSCKKCRRANYCNVECQRADW